MRGRRFNAVARYDATTRTLTISRGFSLEWDEADHQRDSDGKFTDGANGGIRVSSADVSRASLSMPEHILAMLDTPKLEKVFGQEGQGWWFEQRGDTTYFTYRSKEQQADTKELSFPNDHVTPPMIVSRPADESLEYRRLGEYTQFGYQANKALRAGADPATTPGVVEIDRLLTRNRLDAAHTVYRVVEGFVTSGLKVGDRFTDKGFMSVTQSPRVAARIMRGGVTKDSDPSAHRNIITVQLPKGTPAVDPHWGSPFSYEAELVLPRGLSFEVTAIKDGNVTGMRVVR